MSKPQKIFVFALFIVSFGLLVILAINQDFIYDEAWGIEAVAHASPWELITYKNYVFANNHIINTLFIKLILSLNLKLPIFFRLLSLFSFVVYFWANYKLLILHRLNPVWLIFLIFTPFFPFFTFARGYGLAIAALSVAILYLHKYQAEPRKSYALILTFALILSMISIFSFFYVAAAAFAWFAWLRFKKRSVLQADFLLESLAFVAAAAYVYYAGKIINFSDPNIIGSQSLLKNGTLSSLITDFTLYKQLKNWALYPYLKYLFVLTLLIAAVFPLKPKLWREKFSLAAQYIFLIAGSIALMMLAHLLFGAKYPLSRAVLYLEYLLLLLLVVWTKNSGLSFLPLGFALIFGFGYVFFMVKNLKYPSFSSVIQSYRTVLIYDYGPRFRIIKRFFAPQTQLFQSRDLEQIRKFIDTTEADTILLISRNVLNLKPEKKLRDGYHQYIVTSKAQVLNLQNQKP